MEFDACAPGTSRETRWVVSLANGKSIKEEKNRVASILRSPHIGQLSRSLCVCATKHPGAARPHLLQVRISYVPCTLNAHLNNFWPPKNETLWFLLYSLKHKSIFSSKKLNTFRRTVNLGINVRLFCAALKTNSSVMSFPDFNPSEPTRNHYKRIVPLIYTHPLVYSKK